jgi:glycosyltransferase involved in cell wall biosynthesis
MKFKKILMIGGMPIGDKVGGGDIASYSLARALIDMGTDIEYVAVPPKGYRIESSEDFIRAGAETIISQALEGAKRLPDGTIVHIHASHDTQGYMLGYTINKIIYNNIKLIIHVLAPKVYSFPRSPIEIFSIFSGKYSDLVFALSEYSKENIHRSYGIPLDNIGVSYLGVEESFLKVPIVRKKEKKSTLLFVGRIGDRKNQKGLDVLLESMPSILKEKDVSLRIVGPGRIESYASTAKKLALSEKIRFLGFMRHEDLFREYSAADMFVFPSRRESFGLVLAEAMALGLPIVSTLSGAIPEVVQDGENGILVPPDNPEELAKAVISLLDSPDKMDEMSRKGRERVELDFTWKKAAERVLNCYKELIDAPASAKGDIHGH